MLLEIGDILQLANKIERVLLLVPDQGDMQDCPNHLSRFVEMPPLCFIDGNFACQQVIELSQSVTLVFFFLERIEHILKGLAAKFRF